MRIDEQIKVRNYKCFDADGVGFERILPINVIIGKNNSGKSSLIELVQFMTNNDVAFLNVGRNVNKTEVIICHPLSENEISGSFIPQHSTEGIPAQNNFEYGKRFINKIYTYKILGNGKKEFIEINEDCINHAQPLLEGVTKSIRTPLFGKIFRKITAERDVIPEKNSNELLIESNGTGATNVIQQILNNTKYDSTLIEKTILTELNKIIVPDIIFTRILTQFNEDESWEIFFEDEFENRIALSKMGSGIKTVLLVLMNVIARPVIENKPISNFIFAFEELENNLHPSLQRRLYSYIKEFSEKNRTYFFLTTHSNIIIDAFGTYANAQIIHVLKNKSSSGTKTILSFEDNKRILKDLDIKASDLLQSNGIIWVEGPSDRNYINKWLFIKSPELIEGLHYSIMFYGGRLLANLTFDYDWFDKEIIPLLKINTNAFVVMDRDGKSINAKLNETKKRIGDEIGNDNCWITKGREIENYLDNVTIISWLKHKQGIEIDFNNDKDTKLEDNISNVNKKIKLKYNLNKTIYSSEISEFVDNKTMNILDLELRIALLIKKIKEWNFE